MQDLQPSPSASSGASPFDSIRRVDADGEYWSARQLMPLLGYTKWERFEDAVDRASASATAAGHDAERAISRRREMVPQGGAARVDYRLSRYGSYLVAMNGDPRKPAIAKAQAYFAAKTHQAEALQAALSAPAQFDLDRGKDQAMILQALQGLVDKSWLEILARGLASHALGIELELPRHLQPLYVPDFLRSKGITTDKELRSVQSWFGKRALAMAEANGLTVPEKRFRILDNGDARETRAWRNEHLPLFEEVWQEHYADRYDRPMFMIGDAR